MCTPVHILYISTPKYTSNALTCTYNDITVLNVTHGPKVAHGVLQHYLFTFQIQHPAFSD